MLESGERNKLKHKQTKKPLLWRKNLLINYEGTRLMVKKSKILYYLQYILIILKLDMKKRRKYIFFLFQFENMKTFWNK